MKRSTREYFTYHDKSMSIGDIDPQNPALRYICDRFELNLEQRYWLAFLFGCTYCAPTVYYIYNEFPDFENVDINRLQRWWTENKHRLIFQTDRMRIKTSDKFVETFASYRDLIGHGTQAEFFDQFTHSVDRKQNYDRVFEAAGKIKNFGRFSNFIYLELLYELTGLKIEPSQLDVQNAQSCFEGLCYAIGREDLVGSKPSKFVAEQFEDVFKSYCKWIRKNMTGRKLAFSAWGVETTLCAFKKHKRGKRWIGYYIDRQHDEIRKIQEKVTEGVNWTPLWDFREEFFNKVYLTEYTGERSSLERPYK